MTIAPSNPKLMRRKGTNLFIREKLPNNIYRIKMKNSPGVIQMTLLLFLLNPTSRPMRDCRKMLH